MQNHEAYFRKYDIRTKRIHKNIHTVLFRILPRDLKCNSKKIQLTKQIGIFEYIKKKKNYFHCLQLFYV